MTQFNNAMLRASSLLCESFGDPDEENPTFTISTEETPAGVPTVDSDVAPEETPAEEAITDDDIQSMDPTLEPTTTSYDVNDTFVSIDDVADEDETKSDETPAETEEDEEEA